MARSGIMLAGMSSGSGKTVMSCAVMSALRQRGLAVAAGKCGPDYIDPMFHRACLGIPSQNLDLFFCSREKLRTQFIQYTDGADIAVVEGVMGYYDGLSLGSEEASSFDVAQALGLPVILVVPCRGAARSVAAAVLGVLEFQKENNVKAVLLNQVSPALYPRMKALLEGELKKRGHEILVAGYLPARELFRLESRHLGLVAPSDARRTRERLAEIGREAARTIDLELLLAIAGEAELPAGETKPADARKNERPSVRVAVARDEAFCFYYEENLRMLQEYGCELVPFSPLDDTELPADVGGILLGGGYPELYARKLSENIAMRQQICGAVTGGMPCIAECGGFLYLQETLEDEEGKHWPMAAVIPGGGYRTGGLKRFGYVALCAEKNGAYLHKGERIRGHEFHYWDSTEPGAGCLAVKPDGQRSWECVHMEGNLFAGFPHLYFASAPWFAQRFAETAGQWGRGK